MRPVQAESGGSGVAGAGDDQQLPERRWGGGRQGLGLPHRPHQPGEGGSGLGRVEGLRGLLPLHLKQSIQTNIILGIFADITAITKSSISNSL